MKGVMTQLFLLIIIALQAQTYDAGVAYKGTNDYVTYHAGNLPLIISISHGGLLEPGSIPDRSCNGCVTSNDTNTRALGLSIQEAIREITGCEVHVVVNELRRRKLDANREIMEAALGNPDAEQAWTEYHAFLDSAKQTVFREWGRGLVIDLHGHGHDIQRLEIGYRLTSSQLRMNNSAIDGIPLTQLPIRTLVDSTKLTLSDAIRGERSLGDLFVNRGYDAVPSSTDPAPGSGEAYFRGGYITDRYGSKDGSDIDAIQIECHQDVRFSGGERNRFADSTAVVLLNFINEHYHMNIESGMCQPTSIRRNNPIVKLSAFPNPTCNEISIASNIDIEAVSIFNVMGQIQSVSRAADRIIDLSNLPNGMYTMLVQDRQNTFYRQSIVIQCR